MSRAAKTPKDATSGKGDVAVATNAAIVVNEVKSIAVAARLYVHDIRCSSEGRPDGSV